MWIAMSDGFISVVKNAKDPTGEGLMVRARAKHHLESIFPEKGVVTTTDSDYRFRVFVTKEELIDLMTDRIEDLDYTNFKNSVGEEELHDMYVDMWWAGMNLQEGKYKRKPVSVTAYPVHGEHAKDD